MIRSNIDRSSNLVVCLHASASSARQWQGLAGDLAGEVEVLSPQLTGYGKVAPFDETSPFGFSTEIDAVTEQLGVRWQDPQTKIHLVGHSYGAATAMHFAHRYPDRVGSLTLFEPVMFHLLVDDETWHRECREICLVGNYVRSKVGRRFGKKKAARRFIEYWSGKGVWQFLPAERRVRFARLMPKVAAEFEAIKRSPVARDDLEALAMPVRLICGTRTKRPARAVVEILAHLLPNADVQMLENAGHMAPITMPERTDPLYAEHIRAAVGPDLRAAA